MCGIIGVLNANITTNMSVVNFMKQGLVASQLRGTDSTGIFQVGGRANDVYVHRMAANSSDFVEDTLSLAVLADVDTSLINVAHVRARTQGAVSINNAHPFTVAKDENTRLIGVHNGSLVNWKSKKDGNKFDVDSHWAMHHISQNGIEAFEDIHGPYAMVWWEEDDRQRVRMARNDQRPLHLMFNKAGNRMIFASEAMMLGWIAQRVNFDGDGKVRTLPTGKVFTFDTSGTYITWTEEATPAPKYTSYSAGGTGTYSANEPPIPEGYRIFAEQLTLVMAGKETTADATLRYANVGGWRSPYNYSTNASSCGTTYDNYVDYDLDDDVLPPFMGGQSGTSGDDKFVPDDVVPAALLPSARHSKVTDDERDEAVAQDMLGAYLIVEADTYIPRMRALMAVATVSGREYDVVFRNIGKTAGRRLAGDASIMDGVVVGVEQDGTLVMAQTTKRIRDFLEA